MAGMAHPAERDFADKVEMRRAAEEMGKVRKKRIVIIVGRQPA